MLRDLAAARARSCGCGALERIRGRMRHDGTIRMDGVTGVGVDGYRACIRRHGQVPVRRPVQGCGWADWGGDHGRAGETG